MKEKHYLKLKFGLGKDNSPAIYDFLWNHLSGALKELGGGKVSVKIERLEPIDMVYTNLEISKEELKKHYHKFAKSRHLRELPALYRGKDKTTLTAKIKVEKISELLQEYNELFDLFFTDLIIEADGLLIDMMDGFSNSILVSGEKGELEKLKKFVKSKMPATKFGWANPPKK
ncbi:MAG: hypothetical protein ABID38_02115 [Candidatus Diapherotrites archaeon]